MLKRIAPGAGAIGAIALLATMAHAQGAVDDDLLALGEDIYGDSCAQCHRSEGQGTPPAFPALAENAFLADHEAVLTTIREGREAMPPFPNLDEEQLAAVATYIRNSWGNEYGGVSVEDVALFVEDDEEMVRISVWDGIYTDEQAERGQQIYSGQCAMCHGSRLDGAGDDPDQPGAPPVARGRLIWSWDGQSVASLFEYTRGSMPEQNPGSLDGQEIVDILAYMFEVSNMPAGDEELPPDSAYLSRIVMEQDPR